MRRIISILLLVTVIGVSGCGQSANTAVTGNLETVGINESEKESVDEVSEAALADDTETDEDSKDNQETEVTDEKVDSNDESQEVKEQEADEVVVDINNISSPEFASLLKMGWNLGNTFDANASGGLAAETSWGMPKTTKELIHFIKESGFTSIRIPVSWGTHVDAEYNIDPEWMARVREVVDWSLDENLFVIINSHHDNAYYYPSAEHAAESNRFITTVWTQIAEEFKDYDNRLIFESMNEPRLAGTDIEWWFSPADAKGRAAIEEICKLNQAFVDVVRASGGNNPNRFIMVPSYAASPDYALNTAFSMPEDPSNRLMVSIHAYTPYDFAGKADGYSNWDGSKNSEFTFMGKLNSTFIVKGYGVVIGEFGATNKNNDSDRASWARAYTSKAAGFGISYFLWDNMLRSVGEENFGMVDRNKLEIIFPEVFEAYKYGYNQ